MTRVLLIILLVTCTFCEGGAKYDSCKKPFMTWNAGNADKMVVNVTSFEECSVTCQFHDGEGAPDDVQCNYFTWNDEHHPYFRNTCILFSAIGEQEECGNCISAAASCFCQSPFACKDTGTNLVSGHTGSSVVDGEKLCNLKTDCANYTCFTQNHKYNSLCLLYSECSELDDTCSGCCSGEKTFDPCIGYNELTSPIRHVFGGYHEDYECSDDDCDGVSDYDFDAQKQEIGIYQDFTSKYYKYMPDWKGKGWYRFTGKAGRKMAEFFPGRNKCGSVAPAFLMVNQTNQLPLEGNGKSMKVCRPNRYNGIQYGCYQIVDVDVMNCGDYFVYNLDSMKGLVYCGH